ncbi:hypothetical protein LCGC14_2204090, partial [marine sediment metagenome]
TKDFKSGMSNPEPEQDLLIPEERKKALASMDNCYLEVGTHIKNIVSRQAIPPSLRGKILDQLLPIIQEAQLAKVLKHYKYDNPDYDPQAEEFGWYIEHGWLPPAEVEVLKEKLKSQGVCPDRGRIARVLHKAIRQFEFEKCPEAFDTKVHIDQIISACQGTGKKHRLDRPKLRKKAKEIARQVFWASRADKPHQQINVEEFTDEVAGQIIALIEGRD